jgi:hypothetical protein
LADRSKIDAAQAGFKKLMRDQDGKKAMSEYEAEAAAVRAKTTRLKALRLARDAAEGKAAPDAGVRRSEAPASPGKAPAKRTKKPTGTLSGWLKDREDSGHNN